jgi:predicted amidophosphoribosyltransferase
MGAGLGAGLVDLLLPERCVVCGRGEEGLLCPPCRAGLLRLRGTLCARCGAPTAWAVERCGECTGRRLAFASARGAVAYDATARALVVAWKERGLGRLGAVAADLVADVLSRPRADALTWVPADADRSRWRGVSTAQALASELAERWELPQVDLLRRTRRIRRQRGLSRELRRSNVRGGFDSAPAPRQVALIDDVYTTGATVDAVAYALKRAGALRVHVVTFARAVRR